MELKQRKRILNSLPRFNGGLSSSISNIGGDITGLQSYLKQLTSMPTNQEINSIKTPTNTYSFDWKGSAVSGANAVGDLLSQNSKFNNSAARDIKTYGGTVAQMIPGKYGLLAKTAVDLASDTVGMLNYKHTGDEMRNQGGLSDTSINGINYTAQNAIDTGSAYKDVKSTGIKNAVSGGFKGSAAGFAVGGPLGAVVGGAIGNLLGVFSGRKAMIRLKRINRNALMQTEMLNQNQMAQADTEGLQNSYYRDNYDTTGTVLFGANHGKDLRSRKKLNNLTKV